MLDREVFMDCIQELNVVFDLNMDMYKKEVWYKHLNMLSNEDFKKNIKFCIESLRRKPYLADVLLTNTCDGDVIRIQLM